MRIEAENNLCFDIDILGSCIEEMSFGKIDRESFMDSLVLSRLKRCNDKYMDDFNKNVESIMSSTEDMNMSQLSRVINKLGTFSTSLYKYELLLFKMLED